MYMHRYATGNLVMNAIHVHPIQRNEDHQAVSPLHLVTASSKRTPLPQFSPEEPQQERCRYAQSNSDES